MNIKMIVMDLDGTLLRTDKTVSKYTLDVLAKCREKGIMIAIATARSVHNTKVFTDFMTPDVQITSGGSVAIHNGQTIHQALLIGEEANALASHLTTVDSVGYITARTDEGYFVNKPLDLSDPSWRGYEDAIIVDFTQNILGQTQKIVAEMPSAKVAGEVVSHFPNVKATSFTGESRVSFANKNATKWQVVSAVASHLEIDNRNIVAFGDGFNDLEMIEKCGVGVAMANGIGEVKSVANFICDTNDNDGVAKWLAEHLLGCE
ncbi:MAG: HAD family hydrolase [Defluviitaleaceae bacterium]|nr:HAD family hydrolase [Defluviitaleaceae bacterium]